MANLPTPVPPSRPNPPPAPPPAGEPLGFTCPKCGHWCADGIRNGSCHTDGFGKAVVRVDIAALPATIMLIKRLREIERHIRILDQQVIRHEAVSIVCFKLVADNLRDAITEFEVRK